MLEGESSKGFNNKNKGFFVKRKERMKGFGGFLKRREQEDFFPQRNGQKKRKKGRVWPWGVLKKKIAGEFFPTKKWSKWRVLREQERGEWPEGFSLKELAKRKERRKGFGGF